MSRFTTMIKISANSHSLTVQILVWHVLTVINAFLTVPSKSSELALNTIHAVLVIWLAHLAAKMQNHLVTCAGMTYVISATIIRQLIALLV